MRAGELRVSLLCHLALSQHLRFKIKCLPKQGQLFYWQNQQLTDWANWTYFVETEPS